MIWYILAFILGGIATAGLLYVFLFCWFVLGLREWDYSGEISKQQEERNARNKAFLEACKNRPAELAKLKVKK